MLSKTAKDRLTKLANFLEEYVQDDWFNLDDWATPGFTEKECGTVACAVGWAPACFPNSGFELTPHPQYPYPKFEDLVGIAAAECFFDIDAKSAVYLFMSYSYPREENTTKEEVVERIRTFVEDRGTYTERIRTFVEDIGIYTYEEKLVNAGGYKDAISDGN